MTTEIRHSGRPDDGPGISEALKAAGARTEPVEFDLLGHRWDLLPEVFAPFHSPDAALYSEWLPYPEGGSFLEMGCGSGVTAVLGALRGCRRVLAADIMPSAVENARLNAVRHEVADRVTVVHSDMYEAVGPDERFDLVYWNSNAIEVPADFTYTHYMELATLDRDYAAHRAFFAGTPARLAEGGRAFLGFNSRGNERLLRDLAAEAGFGIEQVCATTVALDDGDVEFRLLELIRS
ncbi:methyltransferase domain-containing protein [Streptomyces sp. URMC 123]|uniref:methyltransferase domain-containing protein n=1 Tax=Streptomyces sp. URMC 123 TaxID=3423403 RepID=UPI003F1B1087